MLRGLYTAGCGMMAQAARTDVLANNLANSSTVGFKKDNVAMRAFPDLLIRRIDDQNDQGLLDVLRQAPIDVSIPNRTARAIMAGTPPVVGQLYTGATVDEIRTLHDRGPYRTTGRNLDVALMDEGLFVVETPAGERYTRNGVFNVNAQGWLVTPDGLRVLGENGPIAINPNVDTDSAILVNSDGEIYLDGTYVDRLRTVTFADYTQLRKQGSNLYNTGPAEAEPIAIPPRVESGVLEHTNVNPVEEMVRLIEASRAYETNQKVVQAYDSTLDKAVNEIGRVI